MPEPDKNPPAPDFKAPPRAAGPADVPPPPATATPPAGTVPPAPPTTATPAAPAAPASPYEGIPAPVRPTLDSPAAVTIQGGAFWVGGRLVDNEGKSLPPEKVKDLKDHLTRTGRL